MKKLMPILFFGLVLVVSAAAQNVQQTMRANNMVQRLNMSNGIISSNDLMIGFDNSAPGGLVGDPYVDKHWAVTSVQLIGESKLIEGYLTRFDISSNELEFKLEKGVKVLPGKQIDNIVWIDSISSVPRYLVNGKDFKMNDAAVDGFLEVLVDGAVPLYRKYYVEILKPNFSPALNVGSKDTKVLRKYWLVFAKEGSLYQIKSKKSVAQLDPAIQERANSIIDERDLNLKDESHVIRLFTELNRVDAGNK